MKRYKLLGMVLTGMGKPDEIKPSQMFEDPDGEWVKWEDVKPLWVTWAAILNMNPSQIADFIQGLPKKTAKLEIGERGE